MVLEVLAALQEKNSSAETAKGTDTSEREPRCSGSKNQWLVPKADRRHSCFRVFIIHRPLKYKMPVRAAIVRALK